MERRGVNVECPHCGKRMYLVVEVKVSPTQLIVCHDFEDGGCDRHVGIEISWEPRVRTGKLDWQEMERV